MTNERDIVKLLKGDRSMLKGLYMDIYPKFESLAKRYDLDAPASADLFHEAFIVLIRNIRDGKFRNESNISTYLYAICKNMLNNSARKIKIMKQEFDDNISVETEVNASNEVETLVKKELANMKEDCKELLRLFYFENRSWKEVAERMSYTAAFARVKSNRCKNALRKNLGTYKVIKERYGYAIK